MIRGYDIDGTVVGGPVVPRPPCVFVTGRTFHCYDEACKRLAQIGPVYIQPRISGANNDKFAAEWKARIILELGVTEFWDDNPRQLSLMRTLCPDTTFHQVTP